jgi:hypothetical protein
MLFLCDMEQSTQLAILQDVDGFPLHRYATSTLANSVATPLTYSTADSVIRTMASSNILFYGHRRNDFTTFVSVLFLPTYAALLDGLVQLTSPSKCVVYVMEQNGDKHLFVHHRLSPKEPREIGGELVKLHRIVERIANMMSGDRRGLKLNIDRQSVSPHIHNEECFTEDIVQQSKRQSPKMLSNSNKQDMIIVEIQVLLPRINVMNDKADTIKESHPRVFKTFSHPY